MYYNKIVIECLSYAYFRFLWRFKRINFIFKILPCVYPCRLHIKHCSLLYFIFQSVLCLTFIHYIYSPWQFLTCAVFFLLFRWSVLPIIFPLCPVILIIDTVGENRMVDDSNISNIHSQFGIEQRGIYQEIQWNIFVCPYFVFRIYKNIWKSLDWSRSPPGVWTLRLSQQNKKPSFVCFGHLTVKQ